MTINRRKFLRESILATTGALVASKFSLAQVGVKPQRILIIGAGIAGLAAAYELGKLGHDVEILEARPRVGGRILTIRDFDENLYAEAGAARIHRTHDLTHKYVREFGLPLMPFYPSEQKFAVLENGKSKAVGWDDFAEATEAVMHLEKPNRWQKIAGGNDLLPRAFEQRLGGKIRYESPIVKIAHDENGAAVTFRRRDRLETLRGDRLVCTIPFTMLRKIELAPPFSEAKTEIIETLKYDSAARVLLQTKRRFWTDNRQNGFGFGADFAEIWDSTFGQAGTRGILQNYLRGDYALDLMKHPEKQRLEISLQALEKLFPQIRANFEKGLTKCWSEDPWVLGAWGHPDTRQLETIRRAEGRVHFAGEHASELASWMQGALQSALRVVEEIKVAVSSVGASR